MGIVEQWYQQAMQSSRTKLMFVSGFVTLAVSIWLSAWLVVPVFLLSGSCCISFVNKYEFWEFRWLDENDETAKDQKRLFWLAVASGIMFGTVCALVGLWMKPNG